jgi:hypothetical protein
MGRPFLTHTRVVIKRRKGDNRISPASEIARSNNLLLGCTPDGNIIGKILPD